MTPGTRIDPFPILRELTRVPADAPPVRRADDARIAALIGTGTKHVYVDSADDEDIAQALEAGPRTVARGVDGNTVNQPLLVKVMESFPPGDRPVDWARRLETAGIADADRRAWLVHTVACARVANRCRQRFGDRHPWETSLQLHMAGCRDRDDALELAELQRRLAPDTLVKVPFLPDEPSCLLVARDLERGGTPVNFTSTFSARQAVAAALLADVSRTNVFAGRLDAGLSASRLGVTVSLEAQRRLRALRAEGLCKTLLIVASVRDARVVEETAGCDCHTIPPQSLLAFRKGTRPLVDEVVESDGDEALGVGREARPHVRAEDLVRLYHVEPHFVDFLRRLATSKAYETMASGEDLRVAFEEAGFPDFFARPTEEDRQAFRAGKIPDVTGPLTSRFALDTLFTLHGDADFEKHQAAIDAFGEGPRTPGRARSSRAL